MRFFAIRFATFLSASLALTSWSESAPQLVPPPPLADTNVPRALAVSDVVTLPPIPTPPAAVPSVGTNAALPPAIPAEDPFRWDATKKEVDVKTNEITASFAFFVTNVSAADVFITNFQASCGCTAAQLPTLPYKLTPGAFTKLDVTMDLRGRFGTMLKTVTALTSVGPRPLYVQANIPVLAQNPLAERLLNQQIARADRQAVFRGDCARCHLAPAVGVKGEALYGAACGICHNSEQRAAMVPDLATLKVSTSPDYWRLWITHGKLGSLMPAWGQTQGGPLSPEQIHSLVQYLGNQYPVKVARH